MNSLALYSGSPSPKSLDTRLHPSRFDWLIYLVLILRTIVGWKNGCGFLFKAVDRYHSNMIAWFQLLIFLLHFSSSTHAHTYLSLQGQFE